MSVNSDPSCIDPMPIYAQLTKGRNLFVGQSSSHIQDESSLDGPPVRRSGDSKVALYVVLRCTQCFLIPGNYFK